MVYWGENRAAVMAALILFLSYYLPNGVEIIKIKEAVSGLFFESF